MLAGWTPLKEVHIWAKRDPLCRGIRIMFALLYPSYVEVENSSLVPRQFWRLTEVPPDLDTGTLSGSGSGSESGSFCLLEEFSTLSAYFLV
jgi:hypothetical protein